MEGEREGRRRGRQAVGRTGGWGGGLIIIVYFTL